MQLRLMAYDVDGILYKQLLTQLNLLHRQGMSQQTSFNTTYSLLSIVKLQVSLTDQHPGSARHIGTEQHMSFVYWLRSASNPHEAEGVHPPRLQHMQE
jgi:hypothetical protein